jgi:protein ImuA
VGIQEFTMNEIINVLQRRNLVWHGSAQKKRLTRAASDYPELDDKLAGGFPEHGVVDICASQGIGEIRLFIVFART